MRQVTVKRGLDVRDYVLVAFGGSGPAAGRPAGRHPRAARGADSALPGQLSAFGLLTVDVKNDYVPDARAARRSARPRARERAPCRARSRRPARRSPRRLSEAPMRARPLGRFALFRAGVGSPRRRARRARSTRAGRRRGRRALSRRPRSAPTATRYASQAPAAARRVGQPSRDGHRADPRARAIGPSAAATGGGRSGAQVGTPSASVFDGEPRRDARSMRATDCSRGSPRRPGDRRGVRLDDRRFPGPRRPRRSLRQPADSSAAA